jgi:hypothetical protein
MSARINGKPLISYLLYDFEKKICYLFIFEQIYQYFYSFQGQRAQVVFCRVLSRLNRFTLELGKYGVIFCELA